MLANSVRNSKILLHTARPGKALNFHMGVCVENDQNIIELVDDQTILESGAVPLLEQTVIAMTCNIPGLIRP